MKGLPIKPEDLRVGDVTSSGGTGTEMTVTLISEKCARTGETMWSFNRIYDEGICRIVYRNGEHVIDDCPKPGDRIGLGALLPGDKFKLGGAIIELLSVTDSRYKECKCDDDSKYPVRYVNNEVMAFNGKSSNYTFFSRPGVTDKKESNHKVRIDVEPAPLKSKFASLQPPKSVNKKPFETHQEKHDRMKRDKEILEHTCQSGKPDAKTRFFKVDNEAFNEMLKMVYGLPADAICLDKNTKIRIKSQEFKTVLNDEGDEIYGQNEIVPDGKGKWKVKGT